MVFSSIDENKKSKQELFKIPEEFKIDFLKREIRVEVKDASIEKLSLSKIISKANRIQSRELLEEIAEYYAKNRWFLAAGNIYELVGRTESLRKAEKCYAGGENYLSAIRVCRTIGTPEALKRANDYNCRTC
ncbi:MAG: hypothetical protein NWE91_09110 [Candidatus Bathyarchaeota archaeon]|nr:hypothetical protein [Candidatus Bathyarchaeota archaeon]